MKHEKFLWVILIQLLCLKECFSNSTQIISTLGSDATITNTTIAPLPLVNVTVGVNKELLEIFHVTGNVTTAPAVEETHTNVTGNATTNATAVTETVENVDNTTVLSWNDTVKANYTVTSEAITSQQGTSFWLESTAAIAAGFFLISAVVGYFSCVGYRRFMQKKYGNSQILAGEDVYDTSDLRYFEI